MLKEYDDKNGIPLSAVITPARTHDIKAVTEMLSITQLSNDLLYYLIQTEIKKKKTATSMS